VLFCAAHAFTEPSARVGGSAFAAVDVNVDDDNNKLLAELRVPVSDMISGDDDDVDDGLFITVMPNAFGVDSRGLCPTCTDVMPCC